MSFVEEIVNKGKELNDTILNRDLEATYSQYSPFKNYKQTLTRLQKDFKEAVYRGVYEAFLLEKECEDRS